MTTPTVPNIIVTRADVHALPTFAGEFVAPGPDDGTVWTLAQALPSGRPVWVERSTVSSDPTGGRFLSRQEASVAERAAVWQTTLAGAAFLEDAERDHATEIRAVIKATTSEETRDAIRRIVRGVKA